jgi:hypothetical protein
MLSSILRQARLLIITTIITILKKIKMARISTYPNDTNVTDADKLIGTDVDNNDATKNFTIGDIVSHLASNHFVPYTGATQNVDLGSNSLEARNVTITNNLIADSGTVSNNFDASLGTFGVVIANFGIQLPNGPLELGPSADGGNTGDILISAGGGNTPSWVSNSIFLQPNAAAFRSDVLQTWAGPGNPPVAMEYEITDISSPDIVINNNLSSKKTRITMLVPGKFNIQFSAQLFKTSGGAPQKANIWLRKNEVDVPATNTHTAPINSNQYNLAAWNFFVDANQNDYFEIMWVGTDIIIQYEAADVVIPHPSTPSVILTVNKVG